MSQTLSPSLARCYGMARVARVWKISRASVGDRLRHVRSPHFIDLVGDDRPIVQLGLGTSNAMRRKQAVLAHHPSHTTRAGANASKAQPRP